MKDMKAMKNTRGLGKLKTLAWITRSRGADLACRPGFAGLAASQTVTTNTRRQS